MNFVTKKLDDYTPVKYSNGKYIVSWGLVDNGNGTGSWRYFITNKKPSVAQIKDEIKSYINQEVRKSIETDFYWNGMNVSLTIENQANYKLLFEITNLQNGENLPETIKLKANGETVYYEITSLDEFKEFIILMNKHIRTCLQKANDLKDSIDYTQYE